jgi:hypothetical protein
MAWGARGVSSVSDIVARLNGNDGTLVELHLVRSRRLDDAAYRLRLHTAHPFASNGLPAHRT